ncbi:hypothetical protein [Nocardia sp. NPDC056000]|uniref:hypothetical protein n=1 Tax=Nocardia sp. NPDC056000 TaxID=3345674 RepID=UPI0035DE4AA7
MLITNVRLVNEHGGEALVDGYTVDEVDGREIIRGTCTVTKDWDRDQVSLVFRPRTIGVVDFRSALLEDSHDGEIDQTADDLTPIEYLVKRTEVNTVVTIPDVLTFSWDHVENETCTFAFWIEFRG